MKEKDKIDENLSELFDIEPISKLEVQEEKKVEIIEAKQVEEKENNDYDYVRQNIKTLIQKGNNAMDELLHVARESEHPRAYEVAATLIKNLSELNKDLMEVEKRKQELNKTTNNNNNINVDKAVFVGSTTDLVKLIRKNK